MYEYKCTIDRVVDGDTVDATLDLGFSVLYKSRVRLFGIDTPESRTRNKDEKARGKLAAKFLSDAIDKADTVVIRTELRDSRGKFGRVLGTIVCDGIDINNSMIEIKDQQIKNLQEMALENNNSSWWFLGGIGTGILLTVGVVYALK